MRILLFVIIILLIRHCMTVISFPYLPTYRTWQHM